MPGTAYPAEMREALSLERSLTEWPLYDGPAFIHGHQLFWSADLDRARDLFQEVSDRRDHAERSRRREALPSGI